MSKIICEVCGTSYPETAAQCPICGCASPAGVNGTDGDNGGQNGSAGYTYVKGGRFSKSNVRKRNKAQNLEAQPVPMSQRPAKPKTEGETAPAKPRAKRQDNTLTVVILILLAAIICVAAYIGLRFFTPVFHFGEETTAGAGQTDSTTADAGACVDLIMQDEQIALDTQGRAWLLNVVPVPADTKDVVTYTTSDPSVAIVTEKGKVTAVGPGTATITITCGTVTKTCTVVCAFGQGVDPTGTTPVTTAPETTAPETTAPETTAPETSAPFGSISLNRDDITFSNQGDSWKLYDGTTSVASVEFSSDDESVATFEKGVVTAVGGGMTTVRVKYNGKEVSCVIRCNFKSTTESTGSSDNSQTPDHSGPYTISHTDVTLSLGEEFRLTLKDSSGNVMDVTWSVGNSSVASVSGNWVIGEGTGTTTVSTTVDGETFSCVIRVHD